MELEGRERLRPSGAAQSASVFDRQQRPHLRPFARPPGHPGIADQRRRNHAPAALGRFRAGGHRRYGPHLSRGRRPWRLRLLRVAGARCRHRRPLGQPELARRYGPLHVAGLSHALRQLRQARPDLERLVAAAQGCGRLAHLEPQRALHPVEGGILRRRRRYARTRQCDAGLPAAELAASVEEH